MRWRVVSDLSSELGLAGSVEMRWSSPFWNRAFVICVFHKAPCRHAAFSHDSCSSQEALPVHISLHFLQVGSALTRHRNGVCMLPTFSHCLLGLCSALASLLNVAREGEAPWRRFFPKCSIVVCVAAVSFTIWFYTCKASKCLMPGEKQLFITWYISL